MITLSSYGEFYENVRGREIWRGRVRKTHDEWDYGKHSRLYSFSTTVSIAANLLHLEDDTQSSHLWWYFFYSRRERIESHLPKKKKKTLNFNFLNF
jgi:hypothetical protein